MDRRSLPPHYAFTLCALCKERISSHAGITIAYTSWYRVLDIWTRFSLKLHSKDNVVSVETLQKSRDISVGIALGYGLDDRGSRVRFTAEAGSFSLHRRVQNGSGTHPASYPMSTRSSFLGVKRPGRESDHSPPSSAEVKEWVELYLHSPNTPSWRGA
jgi:hypothetical protein